MTSNGALIVIAPDGDFILEVSQEDGAQSFAYRVDAEVLRRQSRYFENLLSSRFSEGTRLKAAQAELMASKKYSSLSGAPVEVLPRIPIVDVGNISKVSTIQQLTADFLRILHDQPLPVPQIPHLPLSNLANLTVVSDRFDAVAALSRYIHKKRYIQLLDTKGKGKTNNTYAEERVRQKLLIGVFLDYEPWVAKCSRQLILRGSAQWTDIITGGETKASGLWWDVPRGIEDELIQRRGYILDTLNSVQSHFLKLYSSGSRQCRLGYENSAECDSFQLGEMVRFFLRIGTLRLQGTMYDSEGPLQYNGDIDRLIESLRQCPSYQIDRNHAHCGLRVKLIPILDVIQSLLNSESGAADVGICPECWTHGRLSYAWSTAKRPVLWTWSTAQVLRALPTGRGLSSRLSQGPKEECSCLRRHAMVRDLFIAADRQWTDQAT